MTLPPTPRSRDISDTSQHVQLSLRPDSQRKVTEDDVGIIYNKAKAEVRLKSRGTPLRLTYSVLAASLTVTLLVQTQSFPRHLPI